MKLKDARVAHERRSHVFGVHDDLRLGADIATLLAEIKGLASPLPRAVMFRRSPCEDRA